MTQPLSRARMLALTGAGIVAAAARPMAVRAADTGAADTGAAAQPARFPFDYVDREIRFTAAVDGRGPLTFALDSGAGANVVFAGAAQRLGLSGGRRFNVTGASGDVTARMAHVDRLTVGPLTLENQGLLVLDVPAAEAIGLDGIVGWELLRAHATTVDFDASTITVWPGAPDPAALGDAVPIVISDRLARIPATVNGYDGFFDVDTGDNGGISLFQPFLRRTGLPAKAPPRFVLPSAGGGDVGGQPTTYGVVRGTSFRLGPLVMDAPIYRYIDAANGVFARTDLAGNLGCEIWERFTLTFDYARSRVFLRSGRRASEPFVFNRTGLIVNPTPHGEIVIATVPGSPAAMAGAAVGDRLVSVNGRSVEGHGGAAVLVDTFAQPVGTTLTVRLLRGDSPVDFTLTLADLI